MANDNIFQLEDLSAIDLRRAVLQTLGLGELSELLRVESDGRAFWPLFNKWCREEPFFRMHQWRSQQQPDGLTYVYKFQIQFFAGEAGWSYTGKSNRSEVEAGCRAWRAALTESPQLLLMRKLEQGNGKRDS
jgi:hypothetical protein